MSQQNKQRQKIINHLRLSEDEIPLPYSNPSKLGEILQREKRGTIVGGAALAVG